MSDPSSPLPPSSTLEIPDTSLVPRHIAVIMDGNGRWAAQRHLPRMAGHERGVAALRVVVEACMQQGVEALTVFAFSSENWRRPEEEVSFLMGLFLKALHREVRELHQHGVQLRVIGDLSAFSSALQTAIRAGMDKTSTNDRLTLTVAVNYGGRWDMLQAMRRLLDDHPELAEKGAPIAEEALARYLCLSDLPEPDLFIRTGGEQRISNFLLWQSAYTEFYFTPLLWPEFDGAALTQAIQSYQSRERRFGRTSGQVAASQVVPNASRAK